MTAPGFGLSGQPAHLLKARPPLQAFRELDDWLPGLDPGEVAGFSERLKAQFFPCLVQLRLATVLPQIRLYSLEALAAGLVCGGLDGLLLYRLGRKPETVAHPLGELMQQAIEVADNDWRLLDADTLQLQAGYGKHLNRATAEENEEFLQRPGSGEVQLQRALSETFRTGYSLGLIDAAIIELHGQIPEPLE